MKKFLSALIAVMLVVSMCAMNVSAADATVYVSAEGKDVADGATGAKDNPFNNIIDAFSALSETGGTIVIVGTVKGDVKYTDMKTTTDDDGNEVVTDEVDTSYIVMPAHKGTIVVTGEDDGVLDLDIPTTTWINQGKTIYKDIKVNFGSARIMFSSYAGHLIVEETCEFTGNPGGSYFYGTGTLEFYNNCGLAHGFANYPNYKGDTYAHDTVVVFGKDAAMGTIWNGLGTVVNNGAYIVKDNAAVTTFWGCGQASSLDGSVYLNVKGGSVGTMNAKGSNGTTATKAFLIGAEGGSDFTATAADWTATEVNENAALFNNVVKEYKVTGDVKSFVNVANVAEGTKLYAIVDGAAVEMTYCDTLADGVFFSTIEGATNYVFADGLKKAEEPKDDPSSVPTGDNMAVFAILGAVALAGAFTFKKVR